MSMTQGEAVFQAVRAVFPDGKVPPTTEWNSEQKDTVHSSILAMFQAGLVNKNSGGTDEVTLIKYIPGLTNNWVRKDLRLNGGSQYIPKNPGSRTGSGDEQLKNLKVMLTMVTDPEAKVAVQLEIDKRIAAIAKPAVTLDVSKIPEHLRKFVK